MARAQTPWAGVAVLLITGAAGASCSPDHARADDVTVPATSLREFDARTRAYVAHRATLESKVGRPPGSARAEQVRHRQALLANAIRTARKTARPGDIFTPPVVPQFRTIIRRDLQSRDIRDALAAIQEVPLALAVQVNMTWPAHARRTRVPSGLLVDLYPLPAGLEYRLLDRHLVLLDDETDIIVDFIPDAVPAVAHRRR